MFQENGWESDCATDKLCMELCQKYSPSVEKKIKRRKTSSTEIASILENRNIVDSTEKEKLFIGSDQIQVKKSRKNKYKNSVSKSTIVGIDRKNSVEIFDIPKTLKFTGQKFKHITKDMVDKELAKTKKKTKKAARKKIEEKSVKLSTKNNSNENAINKKEKFSSFSLSLKNPEELKDSSEDKIDSNLRLENQVISNENMSIKVQQKIPNTETKAFTKVLQKRKHEMENDINETVSPKEKKQKICAQKLEGGENKSKMKNPNSSKNKEKEEKVIGEHLTNSLHKRKPVQSFDVKKLKKILSLEKESKKAATEANETKEFHADQKKSVKKKKSNDLTGGKLSLKEKLLERLNSARFRFLNEQLYTQTGKAAQQLFENDQESFTCYHTGFQAQVNKWPVNPVDKIIQYIKTRQNSLVVADMGCGEAKIAQNVQNKVYSFDLIAINKYVTACDIAKVPLKANSVDIVVFCLSLMGTNLIEYLGEASRILKSGGKMLIAEVASRFESVRKFKRKIEQIGFALEEKDEQNKMFLWFEFKKVNKLPPKDQLPEIILQPCVYKKR